MGCVRNVTPRRNPCEPSTLGPRTTSYRRVNCVNVCMLDNPLKLDVASKSNVMTAHEGDEYKSRLDCGQLVTLKDVYYISDAKAYIASDGTMIRRGSMINLAEAGAGDGLER